MKDIFELLKHEGHNVEIIKHEGQYVLGCKQCGETLLTEKYLKQNTNECINVFNTLKNEDSPLLKYVKVFLNQFLYFNDDILRNIKSIISSRLYELENKDHLNKIKKVCLDLNIAELLKYAYSKYRDIKMYKSLVSSIFSVEEEEIFYLEVKNKVMIFLKENLNGYSIYDSNDSVIFACKTFKYNDLSDANFFFIINNELARELEEENPTPTDVYTFKNIDDFYNTRPDWEDEEQETHRFNEFMYRIENDLYDFSNIEGGESILLKEAISILGDYDEVDRYVVPARRYLEKYL